MTTCGVLIISAICLGQAAAPTPAPADGLADEYVDGTYGFSIRAPLGWHLIRERVPERRGATLLRMVEPSHADEHDPIVLRHTTTTKRVPINDMLRDVCKTLPLEFTNVEIHDQQVQQVGGLPAAYFSATLLEGGVKRLRLMAIIEAAPRQYFLLIYDGPSDARRRIEPVFQNVLASMRLLSERLSTEEMEAALDAGAQWVASVTAPAIRSALLDDQPLAISIDGKPVGYVTVRQRAGRWKKRDGYEVVEEGWTFDDDGVARLLRSRMFIGESLIHEHWRTTVTTWTPARGDRSENLESTLEEGLRDRQFLLTGQTYALSRPQHENPPIEVGKTYIAKTLIRLLPRMAGELDKPRNYAFTAFDHARAGLILRIVEFKGRVEPPDAGIEGKVFRIDEREGATAIPATLYVDETGRTLWVRSRNLTMRPAEPSELERQFGGRIAEASRAMARLEEVYKKNAARFRRRAP